MRVVDDQQLARINLIHCKQIANRLTKRAERFVMIQISDVLAYKCLAINHERNCVFEISTQSENGPVRWNCRGGARRVTAGSAQNCWAKRAHASNGVIHAARDRPLTNQKSIGD